MLLKVAIRIRQVKGGVIYLRFQNPGPSILTFSLHTFINPVRWAADEDAKEEGNVLYLSAALS